MARYRFSDVLDAPGNGNLSEKERARVYAYRVASFGRTPVDGNGCT